MTTGLFTSPDGTTRCFWCEATPAYRHYHDTEWGFPVTDDRRLFEKLCLEGFQAGLSWLTILNKRDAFRRAFADFDAERMARFTEADVQRLLADPGIVRLRGKIESAIGNARRVLVGPDAKFLDKLVRLLGSTYQALVIRQMRKLNSRKPR